MDKCCGQGCDKGMPKPVDKPGVAKRPGRPAVKAETKIKNFLKGKLG